MNSTMAPPSWLTAATSPKLSPYNPLSAAMPESCPASNAIAPSTNVAKTPHGFTSSVTAAPSAYRETHAFGVSALRADADHHRRRQRGHTTGRYGNRMDEPVVSRPSNSPCALAASLSEYFWLTGILTAPEPTTLN